MKYKNKREKSWVIYMDIMGRLIGCVMKKTNGKADPETAKKLFEERIK